MKKLLSLMLVICLTVGLFPVPVLAENSEQPTFASSIEDYFTISIPGNLVFKKTERLVHGRDFEIVGYTNNVNKGSMTVTAQGIGRYSGVKSFKVKIVAKSLK